MDARAAVVGLLVLVLAYGLGCLNAGYYLVRWRNGRDLRTVGSGNAGARNAGRVLGRAGFAQVFVLDAAKGALAVLLARAAWPGPADGAAGGCAAAALAAVVGHVAPVQLGWRGGKGVATSLGALAALDLVLLGAVALVFGLARLARRSTVVAGLAGFAAAAVLALWARPWPVGAALAALAALLAVAHRENLRP